MNQGATHQAGSAGTKGGAPITPQRIMEMAWGFGPPLVVGAAVRHGVFDALASGPKDLSQLASQTQTSPRGVRAVADALVGIGLLRREGNRYALTSESEAFLVSSKPGFRGGLFRHLGHMMIPLWLKIDEVVKTGRPTKGVNQEVNAQEFFSQFVEDLFPMNYPGARALADALTDELRPAKPGEQVRVLDLAAGAGVWGIALAEKSPAVHVTAVDFPQVTPIAKRMADRRGIGSRYATIEGDLHQANFGTGYRVATLGHILHSEGEARSRTLLKKVYDALAPGGTIAVAEFMSNDDRTGPPMALLFAVNMLVATDEGTTFSFAQISQWLREAGFENPLQLEVPAPSPLVLATKPAR